MSSPSRINITLVITIISQSFPRTHPIVNALGNSTALKECLLAKTAYSLIYPLGTERGKLPGNPSWLAPSFPWSITADGTAAGTDDTPIHLLEKGRFNKDVNVIFGTNTDEFQCYCDFNTQGKGVCVCVCVCWGQGLALSGG